METINQKQAAELYGVTPRRMRQIDGEGNPPPRDQEGRYPCKEFGEWMLSEWRRGVGFAEDGTAFDFDAERARLTHHEANLKAMDEERKRGDLIPANEVQEAWANMVTAARSKMLALPSRIASVCAMKPVETVEAEAKKIVWEALSELAASMANETAFERLLQLIPGAARSCSRKKVAEIEQVFRKTVFDAFGEELPDDGAAKDSDGVN